MMISEFSTMYREAMRTQAPAMFRELTRNGRMQEHVRLKAQEANKMLTKCFRSGGRRTETSFRRPSSRYWR